MPIIAQTVRDQMASRLDAEGSDYYTNERDYIPAINASVKWFQSVVNASIGAKKFGEEIFRELSQARVFRTSVDSRITFAVFPNEPWTITGVYPLPTTKTTGAPAVTLPADSRNSQLRSDLYHVSARFTAKRLTVEEWTKNRNNPFQAGYDNTEVCEDLREYAYLNPYDYDPDSAQTIDREMEIRPTLNQQNVTIFYIKKPAPVVVIGDSIELPDSVFDIIVNKALEYIAWKQGDGTNIATVSKVDIDDLIKAIS